MYCPIITKIWEDMAEHEGREPQKIANANPIIAATNVTAKLYLGMFMPS